MTKPFRLTPYKPPVPTEYDEQAALIILAIDPGTHESGYVELSNGRVISSGVLPNNDVLNLIASSVSDILAIEKIVNYGKAVGQETFDTCEWIGRFQQVWPNPDEVVMVPRLNVKKHVCGTGRAKDPQVRECLIKMIGHQGSKKEPGPTYGVKSHAWSALGVAVTALHQQGLLA